VLLLADFSVYAFRDFPQERLFNVGIREQLMVGMAAGLALEGFIPVCYTIAPFLVERAYEFIKLDICFQELGVLLVGYNGTDEFYGPSHRTDGLTYPRLWATVANDIKHLDFLIRRFMDNPTPTYLEIK
jgi:transketolase